MTWVIGIALVMVAVGGTVVALTGNPERQAVTLSLYGLLLALLFFVLAAPDVALSQLGVGTVVVPLIIMLAVRKTRHVRKEQGDGDGRDQGDEGDQASEASESGEEAGEVGREEAGEGEEASR